MPDATPPVARRRPWWVRPERWAALAACGLAGFSFTATAAMVLGVFGPAVVGVGTVVLTVALAALALDRRPALTERCDPRWFWVAAALIVVASTGVNAARANEHVILNRDPGVYFNAALVLQDEGRPTYEFARGGFADRADLGQTGPGLVGTDRDEVGFQGLHLLPAMGAAVGWVGGDNALARTPALLGGAFLLFLMAFARRVTTPAWALVAGTAMALLIPFVNASRDFLSEIVVGPALFAALWLLADLLDGPDGADRDPTGRDPWRRALLPGALLGVVAMARIDSLLALVGVIAFVGLWRIGARPAPATEGDGTDIAPAPFRPGRATVAAVVGPLAAGLALGLGDGWVNATGYIRSHGAEIRGEVAILLLVLAGLAGWAVVRRRGSAGLDRWWAAHRGTAAGILVGLVVAGTLFALFVRPSVQEARTFSAPALIEGFQQREGLEVDGSRSYDERSATWLAWYLGPVGLVGAVAGGAWLLHRLLTGRGRRVEALVVAVLLPPLLLYLYRPSIYPDHPWASRRYLPVILPLLLVATTWCGAQLWDRRGRWRPAARVAAGVLAAGTIALPAVALAPIWDYRIQNDQLGLIAEVCGLLPDDAAVLVVGDPQQLLGRAIASRCDVPTATVLAAGGIPTRPQVDDLIDAWAADGRPLWLVGRDAGAEAVAALRVDGYTEIERVEPTALRSTLMHRPDAFTEQMLLVAVGRP